MYPCPKPMVSGIRTLTYVKNNQSTLVRLLKLKPNIISLMRDVPYFKGERIPILYLEWVCTLEERTDQNGFF